MRTPSRPKAVPAKARWDKESKLWHAGKTKDIFSYGEQHYWRADGSVYGHARYDSFGSRDGRSEYFHPDGTLAHAQEWKSFHRADKGPEQLTTVWQRSATCPAKYPNCECWQITAPKSIWRIERNERTGATRFFAKDGTPCDKRGAPKGSAASRKKPVTARPTSKSPLVRDFRALEALLEEKGLRWALHYAPRKLVWEKPPKWALASADALLPAEYLAFVEEVGYPMLGFELYCDRAWSFLPPAVLRFQSSQCFDENGEEPTGAVFTAFFAGHLDLADVTGVGFAKRGGKLVVVSIEGAVIRKPLGSFDKWMSAELSRLTKWVKGLSPKACQAITDAGENDADDDPHRLVDYAS